MKRLLLLIILPLGVLIAAWHSSGPLQAVVVTEETAYDTDDPAIWINKQDPSKSLVIGTDKNSNGALYVFDLDGKILREKTVRNLKRPNNVDVAYDVRLGAESISVAVVTERETDKIRIYSVPAMQPVDGGGITVFEGEQQAGPMGIALFTRPTDHALFAIVSRKTGPSDGYLWQYRLQGNKDGRMEGTLVRKFGRYSGRKEIESVAIDNESGYVYYSDEEFGIHKYHADPDKGNEELAVFGTGDFKEDIEGISIYKTGKATGYILVSNQQANQFMVYPREGSRQNAHEHKLIRAIDFATLSSDGSDVVNVNLGARFPKGIFVAMSEKKVFKYFDWRDIEKKIKTP